MLFEWSSKFKKAIATLKNLLIFTRTSRSPWLISHVSVSFIFRCLVLAIKINSHVFYDFQDTATNENMSLKEFRTKTKAVKFKMLLEVKNPRSHVCANVFLKIFYIFSFFFHKLQFWNFSLIKLRCAVIIVWSPMKWKDFLVIYFIVKLPLEFSQNFILTTASEYLESELCQSFFLLNQNCEMFQENYFQEEFQQLFRFFSWRHFISTLEALH